MSFTEAKYENAIIELFRDRLGYSYAYGPNVARDYSDPLYMDEFLPALRRINPKLPEAAVSEVVDKLCEFGDGSLIQKNRLFTDYIQNGVSVNYYADGEQTAGLVYLVDYKKAENNTFTVANQWTITENSTKRSDIIVFLNVLPVVVFELKSPSREETDASEAFLQLRNYMQEIPSLFIYNAFLVMSDLAISKPLSLKEINNHINELLKASIKSEGVINLFSDIEKDFSLFDPNFLDEISKMKERNLAVEILKKLLAEQVTLYRRTNLVKSEKFSELL